MGRLQTWGAAARHSRVFGVVAVFVVVALVAGSVVLATRSSPPPPSRPPSVSTRAVALGDSVPYGHGLANPYLTPQIGLPAGAVSQGPSTQAYPSLVAGDLGLTMTVRSTNCHLTGDQLVDQRGGGRRRSTTPAGTASARSRPGRPGTWLTRSRRPTWSSAPPVSSSSRTGPTTSTSAPVSSTNWPASSGRASGSAAPASPTARSRPRSRRTWRTCAQAWRTPSRPSHRTRRPSPCSTTTNRFRNRHRSPRAPGRRVCTPTWCAAASSPMPPAPSPRPRSSSPR